MEEDDDKESRDVANGTTHSNPLNSLYHFALSLFAPVHRNYKRVVQKFHPGRSEEAEEE